MRLAVRGGDLHVCRLQRQSAHAADGIPRIDREIGQNLVQLRGIHADPARRGIRLPRKLDGFPDEPADHPLHLRDVLVEIQHLRAHHLLASKGQLLRRQLRGTPRCALDLEQVVPQRIP
ncbi:MAG TPA: hypothetical protein VMF68_10540 [Spirochaetia bacterium]|nr:hypothetical protein [Spirochaetia bacterium]